MLDKDAHYLMCKGGVYYFTRHVPNDLQKHYEKPRIVLCLKTRSKSAALKASHSFASKLDDFWLKMRVSNIDVPASHLLIKGQPAESFTPYAPNLSDALEKYCRLKGIGRGDQFFTVARRNIGYVIEHLGDRPLDAYSLSDASSVRDWLFQRNLNSTSIQRIFSTIRAAINITIQEDGLSCVNAFAKTYLPSEERPKRASISPEDIKRVQKVCLDIADERRLLIALISDTGMRLSEALGLVCGDVQLEHECPHIILVPHQWRPLKTFGSKRLVPLVGVSLETMKVIHQQSLNTQFLFPSYTNEMKCNGNSASAALNKWMKAYIAQGVVHSFRHSFRDRLRAAEVDTELTDQLGGWALSSIGQSYGAGHTLEQKYAAMNRIVF